MPTPDSDPSSDESQDERTRTARTKIQEGTRRRGGVNDAPKRPRPNVRPKPQKPSSDKTEGDDEADE